MTTLEKLIERLEKATGPDRALDGAIWRVVDEAEWARQCTFRGFLYAGHRHTKVEKFQHEQRSAAHFSPEYTRSLDAAMSLVPPMMFLNIETGTQSGDGDFEWPVVEIGHNSTGAIIWRGQAKALPLALCIAALKALNSRQSKGE